MRRLKWSEGQENKVSTDWTRRYRSDRGYPYRAPYKYTQGRVKVFTWSPPRSNTVKFPLDLSGRVQSTLMTGTEG